MRLERRIRLLCTLSSCVHQDLLARAARINSDPHSLCAGDPSCFSRALTVLSVCSTTVIQHQQQHVNGPSLQSSQQLHQHQQQHMQAVPCAITMANRQPSLMQGLSGPLQPVCRHFSASSSMHSKKQPIAWPATPQLHQPAQHVQGTDPLKALKAANSAATPAAGSEELAQQEAAALAGEAAHDSWMQRLKATARNWQAAAAQAKASAMQLGLILFVCATGVLSLYLFLETAILASSPGNLRSKNPTAVSAGLRDLQWVMSQEFAKKVVAQGLITDLVALIEPGADAILLNQLFVLLDQLLGYGGEVREALLQSGLLDAINQGLKEGWLPRGAVDAAGILQQRLQYQQQRRLPPVKPGSASRA